MMRSKRATLHCIANELGVTATTVSCILNNSGGKYAEATRQKVFEVAKRLKYRPNALAHGIRAGRTNTAGVMIQNKDYFLGEIINGIHDKLLERDTVMFLTWNNRRSNETDWNPEAERQAIHHLLDRRVDGIILTSSSEEYDLCYFEEIWERGIPLILVDRRIPSVNTDFVGSDNNGMGHEAARHLLDLGHRRLLFCKQSHVGNSLGREEGFRETASTAADTKVFSLESTAEDFADQLRSTLADPETRPTGVFCINDWTAMEVRRIAATIGLEAPRDFSIIGCGNQHFPDALSLDMTTFDQNPYLIGQTAAECYLSRVDKKNRPDVPNSEKIAATLLVRNSTGPAPRG